MVTKFTTTNHVEGGGRMKPVTLPQTRPTLVITPFVVPPSSRYPAVTWSILEYNLSSQILTYRVYSHSQEHSVFHKLHTKG